MKNWILVMVLAMVSVVLSGCGGCSKQETAATTNAVQTVLGTQLPEPERATVPVVAPSSPSEMGELRKEIEELKSLLSHQRQGPTSGSGEFGTRGSGYQKAEPNSIPRVTSLTKRNDPKLGVVYLPNYETGRCIATPPGKPAPQVMMEASGLPDGFKLTPWAQDRQGNTIWIFAR